MIDRLHPDDLAALADLIAPRLAAALEAHALSAPPAPPQLLSAEDVAGRLGRSRGWVYRNADRLGAVALGDGDRPRLGFPAEKVAEYLTTCSASRGTPPADSAPQAASDPSQPRRRRECPAAPAISPPEPSRLRVRGEAPR